MTEREDELAWRERMLDEKEHEMNRIEETFAEKDRSLKAAVEKEIYVRNIARGRKHLPQIRADVELLDIMLGVYERNKTK